MSDYFPASVEIEIDFEALVRKVREAVENGKIGPGHQWLHCSHVGSPRDGELLLHVKVWMEDNNP